MRGVIGKYMEMKVCYRPVYAQSRPLTDVLSQYLADKNLSERTAFKWSILRPGGLSDEPGTGKASIGRTHLSPQISVRCPL